MTSLLAALQSRFTAAGLNSTITGGLYLNIVPPQTAMPYAVARPGYSPTTQTYGSGGGYTEPPIDFIVVGVQANTTLVMAEALRDAYKNQVLTLSSGKMLNCLNIGDPFPGSQFPDRDEQGRDVWEWIVPFRYSVNG